MKHCKTIALIWLLFILFNFQNLMANAAIGPDFVEPAVLTSCQIDPDLIIVTVTDVSCPGSNDGSIMLEVNGSGTFNICITNGCEIDEDAPSQGLKTQTATYINLSPGNYLVSVTDANGCSWHQCFEVGEPEPISHYFDYEPIYCFGHTTEVSVGGTGGTPPYKLVDHNGSELAWFNHETVVTDVAAGDHTWFLHDSKGCTPAQIDFSLTEPIPVIATLLSLEHGICFGHESGGAQFSVSGGAPPYLYNMGDYQDGLLTVENLPASNHTLMVSDSKNCGPGEITFEIEEPEEIIITITEIIPSSFNDNNGQLIIEVNGGFAPYLINLNDSCETDDNAETSLFNEGQEIIFNELEPGWKNISITDQNGCMVSECVEINTPLRGESLETLNTTKEFSTDMKATVHVYPNPFRENAHVEFVIPEPRYVTLEIFNITGLRVATLFEGRVGADETQRLNLSAESLPNGIYICKLTIENKVITKRIILTR